MRTVKLVAGIIFVAAVFYLSSDAHLSNDEDYVAAKDYLRNSPEVIAEIGTIDWMMIKRYVSVRRSSNEGPYRLYDFIVRGEKGFANVVVRAEPREQSPGYRHVIESIDR